MYRPTKQGQCLDTQQGVGGAQLGHYFFRDGQIVVVGLVNHASYPIRIRFLQKKVDEKKFHEIERELIVLQPFEDPRRENRRSIGLGAVKVHKKLRAEGKNKSEEILRVQGTRKINGDDDKAWEKPNLVATFDIEYLVSCKKRDDELDAMTKQFVSIKLTPCE